MFAKILDVANEKYLFCSFSQWWAIIKSLDHNLCFKRAIMLYLFFFLDLQVSSVRRLFFTCGTISSNGCYSGLCIAEGNCMQWILKKKQMSKFEINFWPLFSHLVPFRPCPSIEISIDKEINIETKEVYSRWNEGPLSDQPEFDNPEGSSAQWTNRGGQHNLSWNIGVRQVID